MKKRQKFNKRIFFMLFAFLCLVIVYMSGQGGYLAHASVEGYTEVLEDLSKDASFKQSDYIEDKNDRSIKVIQIAESMDKELFLYTYQPCQNSLYLVATDINMSLSYTVDSTRLYSLKLLSANGVFCKYIVNGVTVSDESTHYYNITSIYREWIKGVDTESGNGNTVKEVSFNVGKIFTTRKVGEELLYSWIISDTVEILHPVTDYIRAYTGGLLSAIFGSYSFMDTHFIAFSTDREIDDLVSADVTYITKPYIRNRELEFGESSAPIYKQVVANEVVSLFPDKPLKSTKRYNWNSIIPSSEFLKNSDVSSVLKNEVAKTDYVLLFVQTPYTKEGKGDFAGHYDEERGTVIDDISILSLEFYNDGVCYKLGAVSSKIVGEVPNPPFKPDKGNVFDFWRLLFNKLQELTGIPAWVWIALAIAIPLLIILPVLSIFFPIIGQILLWFLRFLAWLLLLPFKAIKALGERIRDR